MLVIHTGSVRNPSCNPPGRSRSSNTSLNVPDLTRVTSDSLASIPAFRDGTNKSPKTDLQGITELRGSWRQEAGTTWRCGFYFISGGFVQTVFPPVLISCHRWNQRRRQTATLPESCVATQKRARRASKAPPGGPVPPGRQEKCFTSAKGGQEASPGSR